MKDEQFAFLQRLVETTGPSGYEEQAQAVWRESVQDLSSSITTDSLGNSVAVLNPSGNPRVMLDAHIDEIGFIIKYIDENGFLYFSTIGGFDPVTLAGGRVRLMGANGAVTGVIGRKPTHVLTAEERKAAPELKNMWIDIGATSREEAEALISIGDAGGRAVGVERLHGPMVAANSFDDRVGVYIMTEVFRQLAATNPHAAVFAASTVQEEIGLRGAKTSAYGIDAQVGIAIDVTWTSDHPHVSKSELGDVHVGGGPVITRGANTNPRVFERLVAAAKAESVPYQVEADPKGTSTNQNVMQLSRAGMATGLISVPTRYLHSASEVLSLDDVDASVATLTRFVQDLDENVDLTP